jgi:hypothetical protein
MNELPNTPAGLMHLMPSTGSQITSFSNGIVQAVRRGEENPLDVLLQIRAMEKALKIILDNVKPYAEREAEKYPGDKFDFKGNEVAKCDVKTDYDYTASNDPIYERLLYDFEQANKKLKERETFLKAIKEPMTLVDDLSGEVAEVRPPLKRTVSGLKITIR